MRKINNSNVSYVDRKYNFSLTNIKLTLDKSHRGRKTSSFLIILDEGTYVFEALTSS